MLARRGYVPALDGLRALAVLAVIVSHAWPLILPGGWIGVDVFFVLSGFLITSILLGEHARTGTISLRRFYMRRALRLLPALAAALVAGVLLAVLIYPASAADTAREAVAAVFYVANWLIVSGSVHSGLLVHTWTLSIEEQFYWTWPLILLACLAAGGRRALLWATLAGVALVLAHRLLGVQGAYFRTDARADSLLIGCAVATAAALGLFERLPRYLINAAATCGAALLAVVLALGLQTFPPTEGIGLTVVALAAASVLVAISVRPLQPAARALSWRPLRWLGQRSYGVYLYHPLCIALIAPRLGETGALTLLVAVPLTVGVAALSFRYLESPFLRLKHGVRRPPIVAPVPSGA